jgi:hypothetical protein
MFVGIGMGKVRLPNAGSRTLAARVETKTGFSIFAKSENDASK